MSNEGWSEADLAHAAELVERNEARRAQIERGRQRAANGEQIAAAKLAVASDSAEPDDQEMCRSASRNEPPAWPVPQPLTIKVASEPYPVDALPPGSEWANPAKWQKLVSAIEQRTGPKPEHEAEKARIAKLAWWDEVQAGVAGFPGPQVYHINPVGLVGNFIDAPGCIPLSKAQLIALTISSGFEGNHPMDYSATAGNFDGMGMSYGLIQWNAGSGTLAPVAVEERAKAAKHIYVADCMSRRIGILQQSPYSYTAYGQTSQRTNANFNLISQDAHAYVCQI